MPRVLGIGSVEGCTSFVAAAGENVYGRSIVMPTPVKISIVFPLYASRKLNTLDQLSVDNTTELTLQELFLSIKKNCQRLIGKKIRNKPVSSSSVLPLE